MVKKLQWLKMFQICYLAHAEHQCFGSGSGSGGSGTFLKQLEAKAKALLKDQVEAEAEAIFNGDIELEAEAEHGCQKIGKKIKALTLSGICTGWLSFVCRILEKCWENHWKGNFFYN